MIKEVKRNLFICRKTYLSTLIAGIGAALLADSIVIIVMHFISAKTAPPIGPIIFIMVAVLMGWLITLTSTSVQYNLAIQMGAVRHTFLLANLAVCGIFTFVMILLGTLWQNISYWLIALVGGTVLFRFNFSLLIAATSAVAVTIFGLWMGAMLVRFGRKAFWILWPLWMGLGLASNQVSDALIETGRTDWFARLVQGIARFVSGTPVPVLWLAGILVLAAFALHAWFILYKMAAQN